MDDLIYTVNQVATNTNMVSWMVYMLLVATCCAVEQYRYFNEVMSLPLLEGSTVD